MILPHEGDQHACEGNDVNTPVIRTLSPNESYSLDHFYFLYFEAMSFCLMTFCPLKVPGCVASFGAVANRLHFYASSYSKLYTVNLLLFSFHRYIFGFLTCSVYFLFSLCTIVFEFAVCFLASSMFHDFCRVSPFPNTIEVPVLLLRSEIDTMCSN